MAVIREQQRLDPLFLLLIWAQRLAREDEEMFDNSGVQFVDPADIPKDTRVKDVSEKVAKDMLKERRGPDQRRCSIRHAYRVASEAGLQCSRRGDVMALQRVIGSSHKFAAKILEAIQEGKNVEDLFTKKTRKDAAVVTDVSQRLKDFLVNPEHSRALPGH